MAKFYGILQGAKGKTTRCGTIGSGIHATLASLDGAIKVSLSSREDGLIEFRLEQIPWFGTGVAQKICEGIVGRKLPARLSNLTIEEKVVVAMMRAEKREKNG